MYEKQFFSKKGKLMRMTTYTNHFMKRKHDYEYVFNKDGVLKKKIQYDNGQILHECEYDCEGNINIATEWNDEGCKITCYKNGRIHNIITKDKNLEENTYYDENNNIIRKIFSVRFAL
jgi:antitoxin component YwqK of YwqJK toxin-antitoxin module